MALEKTGDLDRAIKLYEANVADGFDGSHPYDRLRLTYQRQGRHADVIRVCLTYIDRLGGDDKLKLRFAKWIGQARQKLAQEE